MTRAFKVNISAPSIIKDGGTSSQFLKADGSIDSSTYLTTSTASSTYAPLTTPSLLTPFIKRVDSTNEGGQIDFARASDNTQAWYLDVYGNTSTPSFRIVDVSNAAVRLQIDGTTGNISAQGFVKNGGTSAQYLMADGSVSSGASGPLTQTALSTGFSIAGGTTSKTLTVSNTITLAGTDSSTLNIGSGGTLGTGAFATIANYAPLAGATFTGQIQSTLAGVTTTGGGQIYLNGTTGNRIDFNQNGASAPAFTTRSVGTKIVLYPTVDATNVDYAIGIDNSTLWQSIAQATGSFSFKWYAGTTNIATLTGAGALTTTGSITASSIIKSGGTSAQFLKADGSVDSSTYLTTGTASSTYAPINNATFTGTTTLAADPTSALHAATKQYVDNVVASINYHEAVKYATTGALGTAGNLVGGTITTTYANGTAGVGATLTIATSSNWTAITIDAQSLTVNDRVLIKNQADGIQNGIYVVTSVGAIGNTTSFVFTRATDADNSPANELEGGDFVFVTAGTTNAGFGYVCSNTSAITVGTTAITYSVFNTGATISAGTGLTETTPGTLAIDTTVVPRLSASNTFTNSITATSFIKSGGTSSQYLMADGSTSSTTQLDITPLDDISNQFNGSTYRFVPKYQGQTITISNQFRLLLTINGIIQRVRSADYVWQSPIPINGIRVDNDGYIVFPEAVPAGSEFDARLMAGSTTTSSTTLYPFRAVDILLGG